MNKYSPSSPSNGSDKVSPASNVGDSMETSSPRSKLITNPTGQSRRSGGNPLLYTTTVGLRALHRRLCERKYQQIKKDEKNGYFVPKSSQILNNMYRIHDEIGRGAFGQVFRATSRSGEEVAIKILRRKKLFYRHGKQEVKLIQYLNQNDPDDNFSIVRLNSAFVHDGHVCIVFEMLSLNLYELLASTGFVGLSLNLIRKFAHSILKSLSFLRFHGVIHCDIKPENILLRKPKWSSLKIVDFGSSCCASDQTFYKYIQSRFYRSPEVLLELGYDYQIDIWGLGCVLMELHTGHPLFPGKNEADQLSEICRILGPAPGSMIARCQKWGTFYNYENQKFTLKNAKPRSSLKTEILPAMQRRKEQPQHGSRNYDIFLDFIRKLLVFNPEERLTAVEAMKHPFFTQWNAVPQNHFPDSTETVSMET
eukprot:TRINITY_DN233_c0_g1_i2.p1 TRINITY_DN233_c0_g1~~TRINITY_DN233_c0_g1_i2.p1  ORF type:complete len:475 (-),score=42.27 TRINITY_DN233_c0_g1_i2:90-1355(-)